MVIAGRYTVLDLLGKGGVGAVYRASDQILGEDVAVKFLQANPHRDPHELDRFKRELQTARKISHPNVLRIHDIGMHGAEFFISMEILAGGTLAARIAQGPIEVDEAVRIALGICDGLQAAHGEGIVHRDLKPDNVLFDAQDRPKLVDFGLARIANSSTRTVGFSGTPYYMSPEQADGAEATVRSDVYSLGVLFFELFTGRLPFAADSLVRLVVLHTKGAPPKPRSIRPELPAAIDALLLRCLEKDPARRPSTAGEVAGSLRSWSSGLGSGAAHPSAPRFDEDTPPALVRASARGAAPRSGTSSAKVLGACAAVFALVALAGVLGISGEPGGGVVASPTPMAVSAPAVIGTASPASTAVAVLSPALPKTSVAAVTTRRRMRTPAPMSSPVVVAAEPALLDVVGVYVRVTVNGKELPEPPFRDFKLTPGKHVIRFQGGNLDKSEIVDARAGARLRFEIMRTAKPSGELTVIRRR